LNLESLRIGSSIYTSLAVLQAGLRPIANELFRSDPFGLGPNEVVVLQELAVGRRALSLAAIARFLAISRASARQVVTRLAEHELIASGNDPEDRRLRSWHITAAGTAEVARPAGTAALSHPLLESFLALHKDDLHHLLLQLKSLAVGLEITQGDIEAAARKDWQSLARADLLTFGGFLDLWLAVMRAYRHIRAEQTRFFQQVTNQVLDTPSYMALYRVHEAPSGMAEVAAFLRVDQNTAMRIVDRLEQHGLLTRTRNPASRRELIIAPTEQGGRLLETLPPVDPNGAYLRVLENLPRRGATLDELLRPIVAGFVGKPVLDHEIFYALLKGVAERESTARTVNSGDFRAAMAQFLTGVAVVTVREGATPRAITVNSLTSVSLDPPILLICFDRRSPSLKALQANKSFGVSILSQQQRNLAVRFGQRETRENPHTMESEICDELHGVPTIAGALAQIVCELEQSLEAGSHTVVFGAPREVAFHDSQPTGNALGYWRSKFVEVVSQPN